MERKEHWAGELQRIRERLADLRTLYAAYLIQCLDLATRTFTWEDVAAFQSVEDKLFQASDAIRETEEYLQRIQNWILNPPKPRNTKQPRRLVPQVKQPRQQDDQSPDTVRERLTCEPSCTLETAAPPWLWTWGHGLGYRPFSEMDLTPGFSAGRSFRTWYPLTKRRSAMRASMSVKSGYSKARLAQHKALGLCSWCVRAAEPGRRYCARCRELSRAARKRYRNTPRVRQMRARQYLDRILSEFSD